MAAAMPPIWMRRCDFGQTPILAGRLDSGRGIDVLAEGLHRDARRRRDVLVMRGGFRGRGFVLIV